MINSSKLNVRMAFKGLDSTEALKDYAEKRVGKLAKYFHSEAYCHFVFTIEKTSHVAQLHVTAADFDGKAESSADTLYAAIDEVTDKLVHQTRRAKEKQTSHTGKAHHNIDSEYSEE